MFILILIYSVPYLMNENAKVVGALFTSNLISQRHFVVKIILKGKISKEISGIFNCKAMQFSVVKCVNVTSV